MTETDVRVHIVLRPLTITTVAVLVFGIIFFAFGLLFIFGPLALIWSDPTGDHTDLSWMIGLSLTVPISGMGLLFLFRGSRRRLILTDDEAVLHEMFRTYRIPRNRATGVTSVITMNATSCAAIEWKDPKGDKERTTKVSFLSPAAVGGAGKAKLEAMTDTVREWCRPRA